MTQYEDLVTKHVADGGEIVSTYGIDFEYTNEDELTAHDVVRVVQGRGDSRRTRFEEVMQTIIGTIVAKYGWAGKEDLTKAVRHRLESQPHAAIFQIQRLHFSFDYDDEPWRYALTLTVTVLFVAPEEP